MTDYLEKEDNLFRDQLSSFGTGLDTHGATLGFTTGEISAAKADAAFFDFIVQRQVRVQEYSQAFTGWKNEVRYGNAGDVLSAEPPLDLTATTTPTAANLEKRFRQRAAKAKASPNYTKSIGETLKIEKPETVFVPEDGKPAFKIFSDSGHPVLKWKKGNYQGVEIWKDEGKGFAKLERDFQTPYADTSALPSAGQSAVWKYKMIYLLGDKTIGNWSDEISVSVYGAV